MNEALWITLITFLGGLVISIMTALMQEWVKGNPQLAKRLLYSISVGLVLATMMGYIIFRFIPTPPPTAFDFESGTQGWIASDNTTPLFATTSPTHSGKHALEVKTQLSAPANIEVTAYFNKTSPAGFNSLGPYDFVGKNLSCFMYLPSDLGKEVFIQVFVKDINSVLSHYSGTEYSQPYFIDPPHTGRWIEIPYKVGTGTADPKGFNATQVDAMGIRIETLKGSQLRFKGSFYIDDCTII